MSTVKVDTIKNTSNVEVFTAKAWVNFNGTGTVAIRASGNVSSITDNGVGSYTVNLTSAMPDTNYSTQGNLAGSTTGWSGTSIVSSDNNPSRPKTSSAISIVTFQLYNQGGANTQALNDMDCVNVTIHR